ncbi:baseplate J/gp47 family protein [Chitiniphilus eburneus]|uniref:baseplate assembly protein n=1 Tax=Chitiniphilus eburneus TaxID=2571148 RepID=UPI0035CF8FFF
MAQIDPAQLPAPALVETIEFEAYLAQRKAEVLAALPEAQRAAVADVLALESEPMTVLLITTAYHEMTLRQHVNEAAVATMLVRAGGADLDNRAADYGVSRLLISPGDPSAVPPVPPEWESDERLRLRAQMALEGLSVAGSRGAYLFHALSASADVADAQIHSPAGGDVHVYVLDRRGDGIPDAALRDTVQAALSAETVRPLCDRVEVKPAVPIATVIHALLEFEDGGEALSGGLEGARARIDALLLAKRRLNGPLARSALDAALHIAGVRRVQLLAPAEDLLCDIGEFPTAAAITLERR